MGLDFGGPRLVARLAQGDYVAVQVPFDALRTWDWSEYKLNPRAHSRLPSHNHWAGDPALYFHAVIRQGVRD
jgi:hypothetical protein